LDLSIGRLVSHPLSSKTEAGLKQLDTLVNDRIALNVQRQRLDEEELRLDAEISTELAAIESLLKRKGQWFKGLDEVAKRQGVDRRTVRRRFVPPRTDANAGNKPGKLQGDQTRDHASPGAADIVTNAVNAKITSRLGRQVRF
jgi:hypothetical protein